MYIPCLASSYSTHSMMTTNDGGLGTHGICFAKELHTTMAES